MAVLIVRCGSSNANTYPGAKHAMSVHLHSIGAHMEVYYVACISAGRSACLVKRLSETPSDADKPLA
eukprot:4658651-Pleurochrysis_carterae.AAC.1